MPTITDSMSVDKGLRTPNDNEDQWLERIRNCIRNDEDYHPALIVLPGDCCYTNFNIEISRCKEQPIALECRHCWNYVNFFREHSPEGVVIAPIGPHISIVSNSSSTKHLVHDCTP